MSQEAYNEMLKSWISNLKTGVGFPRMTNQRERVALTSILEERLRGNPCDDCDDCCDECENY